MVKSISFEIIFSEFDDIRGPNPIISFPEIDEDFANRIAMKSIDIISADEIIKSKSLAILPFPKENKKGIARYIEWKDETSRGAVGTGSLTLIFEEVDDLIYYKYIKDLEVVFDKASAKIIELKTSKSNNDVLYTEIKKIHEEFLNQLEKLRNLEMGNKDASEEFPKERKFNMVDEFSFKIVVCGDPACGKTSTVLRFTDRAFRRTYIPTLGVNITNKDVRVNDKKVTLVLWDIAGQMKFKFMRHQFYAGAKAILLLFDLTRVNTFKSIPDWYKDIKNGLRTEDNLILVLCGNKVDLTEKRNILVEDVKSLANELKVDYLETSALTGENVDLMFHSIAKKLIENYLN